ncbi:MAG: Glycerol-3-phosphate ABC transporter, ATP-binding protein UgpC, partial [uncultured Phycisphaerae bacterium]
GPRRTRERHEGLPRRRPGRRRRLAVGRRPGVRRPRRAERVRQEHHAADDRRARGGRRRHRHDRRPGGERRAAEGPGHRHGVPELRPVPAHDRVREHVVCPATAEDAGAA